MEGFSGLGRVSLGATRGHAFIAVGRLWASPAHVACPTTARLLIASSRKVPLSRKVPQDEVSISHRLPRAAGGPAGPGACEVTGRHPTKPQAADGEKGVDNMTSNASVHNDHRRLRKVTRAIQEWIADLGAVVIDWVVGLGNLSLFGLRTVGWLLRGCRGGKPLCRPSTRSAC